MLEKHMDQYIKCCIKTMDAFFNLHPRSGLTDYKIELQEQFVHSKDTCVHIPFFGSISGEFFFALNMAEWRYTVQQAIGMEDDELVFSSMKEFLNTVAGETITSISKEFPNLTYLSPRITQGKMNYPAVKSISACLQMETLASYELGISIDMMKIDLNEKFETSISELNKKQRQLGSSERINVLGSLVENVLQDLKQPIKFLDHGLGDLKQTALRNEVAIPEKINGMIESLTRIKNIAGTLVNFTNATSSKITEFNLIECANKAVKVSKFSYPNDITVEIKSSEVQIPPIRSNPRQVEQVIFNLLLTSFEALENTIAPKITIETFVEHAYCGFRISHNGKQELDESRLWEPMFSRNRSGNITSLGLSVCREILSMYGGDIFLDKEDSQITFTLILPVAPV